VFLEPKSKFLDPSWDYVKSDYLSYQEMETEADVPVPATLLPVERFKELVGRLKKSQKIGILCWMGSEGLLSLGGRKRLASLQNGASIEALFSAEAFAKRLSRDEKLQKDFRHHMRALNRRPFSATWRRSEKRRIGVGYRDKGTLPVAGSRERRKSMDEAWIPVSGLPEYTLKAIKSIAPFSLSDDGEFIDSQVLTQYLKPVWAQPEVWLSAR
jgi:hypothetical protein